MPLLLLLAACVFSRTDWVRERDAALCDLYVDCFHTYADQAACHAAVDAFDEPDCPEFSAATAQDCVDALRAQAADCPTDDVDAWQIPSFCAQVCATSDAVARRLLTPAPSGGPS